MNDTDRPEIKLPDPAEWSRSMAEIAQRSQRLVLDFMARQIDGLPVPVDPLNVAGAFLEMTQRLMSRPGQAAQAQFSLWQDYLTLWQRTTQRFLGGEPAPPVAEPRAGDRRFKDAGLAARARLRLHQAVLSPDRALAAEHRAAGRRPRRQDGAARSTSIRGNSSTRWRRRISC